MAATKRESAGKSLLDQRHPRKTGARKPNRPLRSHRHLVTLSEEEISRREQGWNDRFTVDPPPKSNKALSPANSPTFSTPSTPLTKESKIRNERTQYGKRGRRSREKKKPSSGKLIPLSTLSKPPEAAQPSKEEKLRFKVLKVIDARETLLYQLSALILCTPVQESLFLPSRPTGPPTSNTGGRQQMRSRGGMALASTPLSRHGGAGAMTNAREATKLAQQLATNLQVTGIQCVEALVEWMLEAGAQAETPPPFLWRGRNYFLKMFGDLDFAEAELQARGVNLDCFSQHNPLLIKPNQKLGRVLAAHSVIMEMIEFAKDMTPMELLALSGRMRTSSREHSEAKIDSQTGFVAEVSADNNITHSMESDKSKIADSLALEHHGHDSAAELVNLLDESMDFIRGASREQDGDQAEAVSNHEGDFDGNDNGESEEQADRPTTDDTAGADCPKEQFPLLETMEIAGNAARDNKSNEEDTGVGEYNDEESQNVEDLVPESEIPLPEAPEEDASPEQVAVNNTPEVTLETKQDTVDIVNESGLGGEQHSSRSNGDNNQSGYENSFDADADAGDDEDDKNDEAIAEVHQIEKASDPEDNESSESNKTTAPEDSADDEITDPPASENPATNRTEDTNGSDYDNSFDEEAEEEEGSNDVDTDNTIAAGIAPPILDLESVVDTESQGPVPETDDSQTVSKRLETELKRWAFLEDENHPTEVNVQGCLTWCSAREWKGGTQGNTLMREYLEGSIISMLDQYGLVVPETPLESFLSSEVALELDLASRLVDECQAVLGDICSVVAEAIQSSLGSRNSLVSEIEIEEVFETAEAVRQEYHGSMWEYVKTVTVLLLFVSTSHVEAFASIKVRSPVSSGLSRLVKVFYPYLVNQSREELSENWHSVSSLLVAMGLPVDCLYALLDPVCKTLLLAVELSRRSNQDFQNEEDLTVYPKVTVVCDRDDVLQSSVDYVWRTHLSSETVPPIFSLFPFFKSSFGEKVVDGVKVEEGEGKGPLKEWFTLVGNQLMSKWKQIPLPQCMSESSTQITASGNAITVPGASDIIKPGFQLEWETTGGEKIRRVVNKSVEDDTFLLDRTVPPHSFSTSQMSIWHPTTAIFEYVQGSESYWLNENTRESPETRNVLVFVGWFLASAVTHFSSIQVRIHPLLFRLLLDPQHCVKLEELQSFDLQLFQSLSRMKDMKALDFAEYLKFEGADKSLSVGGYIDKVLEDKFGSASGIGWQLQALRRGFSRVIGLDQLSRVGIAELELVESVCGSNAGPGDDFVVNEVFRVAGDAEFTTCGPLMNAFWQTVNNFDPQLKRKFVKFVTGVDTLPVAGTEFLRIEMPFTMITSNDREKCLQLLPQAHTCDNTLELPHYWKALCWKEQHDEHESNEKLEEELVLLLGKKLQDALEYSSGYGLDATTAVAGVLGGKAKDNEDGMTKVGESYDSLGLPALSEGQSAVDLTTPSSQTSETEQGEAEPTESDVKPEPTAVSPRPDESYEEDYDDWEEESMA